MARDHNPVFAGSTQLHPFVKLAIAYVGIVAGLAVIGLVFYVVASQGEAAGSRPAVPQAYYVTVAYYVSLAAASAAAVLLMAKRSRRTGAYLAFAALASSILAPHSSQTAGTPFQVAYWFMIPNAVVGILLMKAVRTLR